MCAYSIHNHALTSVQQLLSLLPLPMWPMTSPPYPTCTYFDPFDSVFSVKIQAILALFLALSLSLSLPISLWLNDFFGPCFYFLPSFLPPPPPPPPPSLLSTSTPADADNIFSIAFAGFSQRFISFWFYYLDFCHSFPTLYLSLSLSASLSSPLCVCCTFFMSLKRLPHATTIDSADINENISCGAAAESQKNFFPYAYCMLYPSLPEVRLQWTA